MAQSCTLCTPVRGLHGDPRDRVALASGQVILYKTYSHGLDWRQHTARVQSILRPVLPGHRDFSKPIAEVRLVQNYHSDARYRESGS